MAEPAQTGVEYHLIQRTGKWGQHGWWRPLAGIITLVALMLVVPLVIAAAFLVGYAVAGEDIGASADRLVDTDNVTPSGLAYLNLSIAAAIPGAMLVMWAFHGLRPRWLASVLPRLRWTWLVVCLGLSVLALVATVVVGTLVPADADTSMSGDLNSWTATTRDFALVVLLLTPLQAAGEEYAFRGYLTQAFGALFRQRWAAVLFPALLFALAHGAQDLPIFFDRFAFGVVAGILVIATGGLEAGIAMHVLNNFLAFGLALAYGDMSSALNPTGGTWWSIPVTLTQSLVYLGLAVWMARAMKVRRRTEPVVLEGLRARM